MALAEFCPRSVSESFLHVVEVVVRRQDTSSTGVQVDKPFVGDMRVAQVYPRNLLPGTFGKKCALQTPGSSPISLP